MKLSRYLLIWAAALAIAPVVTGCSSSDDETSEVVNKLGSFTIPVKIDITSGGEYTFSAPKGSVPTTSDYFLLEGSDGISTLSTITAVTDDSFTVRFSKKITDGVYRASIKSGDRLVSLGNITIVVVDIILDPIEGSTVYGYISTKEGGLKGVVVSDGYEVTTTDEHGVYSLNSKKTNGLVFISVPAGYEVETNGVMPLNYKHTVLDENNTERIDFRLTPAVQENYKVIFLGDMHLANRTNDVAQFKTLASDVRSYCQSHGSEKIYAITLGDMTWDLYWYDNKFQFADYVKLANEQLAGLTVYHTMGNHDNDMKALSDFSAETQYRAAIAPNYYSFNIGKVHYVVLDDINCDYYDGSTSRNYFKNVTDNQLLWLEKDLKYVDKTTPLVITSHAPYFRPNGVNTFKYDHDQTNTDKFLNIIKDYKVHFVTGHTHVNFNAVQSDLPAKGYDITEHNVAAVCGSWWWSGYLTGQHLCTDGSPGGYAIWDINGTDFQWIYKGSGMSEDVQFRAYDLNKVSFSLADVPNMKNASATVTAAYNQYVAAYPVSTKNEVLINIWNWNSNWTLTVTTPTGQALTATKVEAFDPQHIVALSIPRFDKGNLTSTPSFITEKWQHFFKVTAPDATSTLTITVKDEFGHTWTEEMTRPKAFTK